MADHVRLLSAFVASPSDVAEERDALEALAAELNLLWGPQLQTRLQLLKWETHAHPDFGVDAQSVINEQIRAVYEIFIGIFWARIGTKTARAASGTVEEFERALVRQADAPGSIKIMLYFKDAPLAPSQMDPEQLKE